MKPLLVSVLILLSGCCPTQSTTEKPPKEKSYFEQGQSAGMGGLDRNLCPYPEADPPGWHSTENGGRRSQWLSGYNEGVISKNSKK